MYSYATIHLQCWGYKSIYEIRFVKCDQNIVKLPLESILRP